MKKIISYLTIITLCLGILTGCEINNNVNKKDETPIENKSDSSSENIDKTVIDPIEAGVNIINSSKSSTRIRSVEGHIKDVEYAALEAAFKDGTGDIKKIDGSYNSRDSLDKELAKIGVSIPTTDQISCNYYKIVEGTVTKATGCKKDEWNNSYTYTQGEKTIEE